MKVNSKLNKILDFHAIDDIREHERKTGSIEGA